MKKMRLIGTILCAGMIVVSACKKKEKEPDTPAEAFYNVSYGADPRNVMDVHLPENRSADSTKVMVFIHGGGWTSGNKTDITGYLSTFKKNLPNYAIVTVNYRLCSNNPSYINGFPTQEEDIQQALEFIKASSSEWQISNKKIVLVGMSAGAHLSLLQAYKHNSDQSIKAVAAFFPPTHLAEGYDNLPASKALIELVTGGTPNDVPQVYFESSPANYTNTAVPTILFHGVNDDVVPIAQSILLKDSLFSKGKIVNMIIVPTQGHGFTAAKYVETIGQIGVFFSTHNP
jgi:acetyl esterase/lipase